MKLKIKLDKRKELWQKYSRHLYLLGVILLMGGGGYIAYLGNELTNPLLITVGFAGLAGGVMLFWSWRQTSGVRVVKQYDTEGKELIAEGPPNSLVLHPNRVEFAYVENAPGQSQKCYNDGKHYHILQADGESKVEFRLPDDDESERYYDPQEFANPVTMPSNKKYFTWSASTMQKVSLGIMAIIIGGEIIGLITIGG